MKTRMIAILAVGIATLLLAPDVARACPTCYGASDGPMREGMNMAVLAMLGITGCVLGAISMFFLMMRHRLKQLRSGLKAQPYVSEQGILQWNNS